MHIIRNIPSSQLEPSVATIGFFDGVHAGHRFLIDQVKRMAATRGLRSALVTFPIHPRKIMNSDYKPELLTTYEEKIYLLKKSGVEYCMMLDFTRELSRLSAHQFMKDVLQRQYNVHTLVIGYDHRFGHNREDCFEDYERIGMRIGMEVVPARACVINNITISSSIVRTLLQYGEMEQAAHYLRYKYFIRGKVVGGYKLGRTLGYPTANIKVDDPDKLIPMGGVYAVRVIVNGSEYGGMLNIGNRPTMNNGKKRSVEVHIFNFYADIYDCAIRINFIQRIRAEMKFNSREELIKQLDKDASIANTLLEQHGPTI